MRKEIKRLKDAQKIKQKKTQCTLLNFVRRSGSIDKTKRDTITDAVVEFIVKNANYFEVVEKESFRNLIFKCESNYIGETGRRIR